MSHLIKILVSICVAPVIRILWPVFERSKRLFAYLILASRIPTKIDPSIVILGAPDILGTGNIHLGRNLLLYPNLYLETRDFGYIDIGDDVVISKGTHIVAYSGIKIGEGSMIGEYSSIRDGNHRRAETGAIRDTGHDSANITIGKQVWIGRGVTILTGVSISDRATVGANAVVTHDVPAGVVVAGVPARIISRPHLPEDLHAAPFKPHLEGEDQELASPLGA